MKKTLLIVSLVMMFALSVVPALALNVGLEYGTYTGLGTMDLRAGIMSIINIAFGFLGIIAIVIILYGGFVWFTSMGSEEKISSAKKIIIAGIIGLVIIFVSYAIANFVITQLITATGAQ